MGIATWDSFSKTFETYFTLPIAIVNIRHKFIPNGLGNATIAAFSFQVQNIYSNTSLFASSELNQDLNKSMKQNWKVLKVLLICRCQSRMMKMKNLMNT